jgi:UV DNA damage endonuclease
MGRVSARRAADTKEEQITMDRPYIAADLLAGRRLGFACLVRGKPKMKTYDGRKWQNGPHLRVSIELLRDVFHYLDAIDVRLFRLSSQTAPYITHPTLPQFWHQLEKCRDELADLGALARRYDLRLSMHPGQYTLLNAADEAVYAASLRDLDYHAALLDALGLGPEHKVITHVGGVYGDKAAAMGRFVARYEALPAHIKARLVLENDETSYALPDVLAIHAQTGIPVVWDWLHHEVNNPDAIPADEATRLAVATWPAGQSPKIHYSSQRREERQVTRRDRATGAAVVGTAAPLGGQHADYIDAAEFARYLSTVSDLPFDIMLEAKAKDLALIKLRDELRGETSIGK